MATITIYEFDGLVAETPNLTASEGLHPIPPQVYQWLEEQCLRTSEQIEGRWVRLTQRGGRRAIQVTSFVGVIRAPDGFQIEVLPKIGKASGSAEARQLLIDMLSSLQEFRHIQTDNAKLLAVRMPLLEVFIAEFLQAVGLIVKRGLRSDYSIRSGNLPALRGKLLMALHLRQNLTRADRFFTEHDEFSMDRPENRLLHAALQRVLTLSASWSSQQLARELTFVFSDIPSATQIHVDFQRVRFDRGMNYYANALAWARLILNDSSPLTGTGPNLAPSLLFPMEAVFEAFVTKHLAKQLARPMSLKAQSHSHHLVRHLEQGWFRLKPDLLVRQAGLNVLVLDTKWKLLDKTKANGTDKYGLSQGDLYQLQAYGQSYLGGHGNVVLIYPKTETFDQPLPAFEFFGTDSLKLWVLPFCLKSRRLLVPHIAPFSDAFSGNDPAETVSGASDRLLSSRAER